MQGIPIELKDGVVEIMKVFFCECNKCVSDWYIGMMMQKMGWENLAKEGKLKFDVMEKVKHFHEKWNLDRGAKK